MRTTQLPKSGYECKDRSTLEEVFVVSLGGGYIMLKPIQYSLC